MLSVNIIPRLCCSKCQSSFLHVNHVKLGFTGVYIIFLILLKKNIDCGYSLEPPRRGRSNEYPQSMFLAGYEKYQNFFIRKISLFG